MHDISFRLLPRLSAALTDARESTTLEQTDSVTQRRVRPIGLLLRGNPLTGMTGRDWEGTGGGSRQQVHYLIYL